MLERTRTYEIIRNTDGSELVRVPITADCKAVESLMTSKYITLVFTLESPLYIPVGAYVDDELFGRYYVTAEQMPTYDTATDGYKYTLTLNAWFYLWNLKAFMLTAVNIETGATFRKESVWYLTNCLKEQLREFLINLQSLGYVGADNDFKTSDDDLDKYVSIDTDNVPKYAQALTMSYSATMMLDALKTMASTWECEYWITGDESGFVIHFGKCEVGTEQTLTLDTNMQSITAQNNVSDYADKMYFFGGKDNLPNTYRKELRMYAYDVKTNDAGNVASFQCKKKTTDTKVAELTADNLPDTFKIKFVGGGITTSSTYATRGTISEGQNNIVSAFTSAHSEYANHAFTALRKLRYHVEVTTGGVTYDASSDTERAALNDYAYNHASASAIVRVVCEQVTELYNAETKDFDELRRDAIALSDTEWRNLTGLDEIGYPYNEKRIFTLGSMYVYMSETSATPDVENIPTSGAYLVSAATTAGEAYTAINSVSKYGGEGSVVSLHYALRSSVSTALYYTIDGDEVAISDADEVNDKWNDLQDYYVSQQVKIKADARLTLKEWQMVAGWSNGALVANDDGTFTLGGLFTLSMTTDGKALQTDVFSYDDESVDLPTIPTSVANTNIAFSDKFVQIVPTSESTKYSYYHETTLVDTLDVSGSDDTSAAATDDDTTLNLCYQTLQREYTNSGNTYPFNRFMNCASAVSKVGTDAALDASVVAQTIKARVKIKAFSGISAIQLNGSYAVGLMDGLSATYSKSALYVNTLGDTRYSYSVAVSSGKYTGAKSAVTASNGYFYVDVEIPIAAGSSVLDMTDFTQDATFYGYAVLFILNVVINAYDADGASVTPENVAEDDVVIELYQDSPLSVVINGTGVKTFSAHAGRTGSSEDTTRIYFDTAISSEYFSENTELLIVSDYIYKVPYIYYISTYDDPTSITTIGDQRLQLPRYDADDFAKYKRDGWTYENGYIICDDMAYKDGYIIPKSLIGNDDAKSVKEMAVVDDNIYPDGKLLVSSITKEPKTSVTEVEGDDDIPWSYYQYHLTLERPDGSTFTFKKDYILQNSETLKIRFLVPEDIADDVDEDTLAIIKQNCRLAGMQFDCNFRANPSYTDDAGNYGSHPQDYTIVRNDDFGMMLPNETLNPAVYDPCVLVNWNVKALAALGLITEAEYRLLEKAFEYFAALKDGNFTFTCNMMSSFMFDLYGEYIRLGESEGKNLKDISGRYLNVRNGYDAFSIPQLGQKVVISTAALKADQSTRVIGYEYKLDKPFDTPKLTCGESEAYSRIKQLEKDITNKLS